MFQCLSRFAVLAPVTIALVGHAALAGRQSATAQGPPAHGQPAQFQPAPTPAQGTPTLGPTAQLAPGYGAPAPYVLPHGDPRPGRQEAINAIPLARLTPAAQQRITSITSRPTLYRHLSQQSIQCDPDLFLFIARNPEILVGIWDLMEITQVQTQRVGPYQLRAVDGSGTDCTIDLVYGDPTVHVYVADGFYDGKLTANPINGKGVFVLRCQSRSDTQGNPIVDGTLDCFVQVDHLAADLIIRTFGPLIGRTADNNFLETARFVDQLGSSARSNPSGLEELALRLPQVSEPTRNQFAAVIRKAAERHHNQAVLRRSDLSRGTLSGLQQDQPTTAR